MNTFKFLKGVVSYDRHNTTWKTAAGRHIPLDWMTTNHITNALGCLKGVGLMEIPEIHEGKTRQEWIDIFEMELRVREEENLR